jgi:hypothetical protein
MRTRIIPALFLALMTIPANAWAQSMARPFVDTYNPSARGAALADAGGVVPEGPFAVRWNPAGLAMDQPASVGATYNELATGLTDDAWVYHLGAAAQVGPLGLGVYFARYDQGDQESQGTNTDPNDPEAQSMTFESSEHALRFGAAVDIIDLMDVDTGESVIDLCLGLGAKWLDVNRAPAEVTQDLGTGGGSGEASSWTMDAGALVRYGQFLDLGSSDPDRRSYIGVRGSFAYDSLIENDLDFVDADQSDPLPKRRRYGVAVEASLFPRVDHDDLLQMILLYERLDSLVEGDDWKVNSFGLEMTLANLVVVRGGLLDGSQFENTEETYGAGLRLYPRGASWGVELEYANRPDVFGTDRLHLFTFALAYDVFNSMD